MRAWIVVGTVAALLALAVPDALAGTPGPSPLPVRSASLTQNGLQLVWRVQLAGPFSPQAMRADGRTLCLVLERARSGSVSGVLCVAPPGKHGRPVLVYQPVTARGRGRGQAISATLTRSSDAELTASFLPSSVGVSYSSIRWQVLSTLATQTSWYPRRPALAKLHTPMPVGCVPSGSSLVFGGPTNVHEIALTFDDGPWPQPPSIDFVNLLARYHVPATFFEIGDQIGRYDPTGSVERQMLADGDMIGDHTWTHPDMNALSPAAQTSELELTAQAIRRNTGFTTCLWRPPYEDFDNQVDSLARSLGFLTINYDVDTQDWTVPGESVIYQRAVSGAHNGAIILQHFGGGPRYETLAALPGEINTLRGEGYEFVTIPQLLGLQVIYK